MLAQCRSREPPQAASEAEARYPLISSGPAPLAAATG